MLLFLVSLLALTAPYEHFRRVEPDAGITMVESLAQDWDGLLWFGTNRGLYCHDGYSTFPVEGAGRTYSIVSDASSRRLYLGTEGGLAVFDGLSGVVAAAEGGPGGIRSVVADADSLWLGSFQGLYSWREGRFTPHPGLRTPIVYSLLDTGNILYIGTYDGLAAYRKDTGAFTDIPLPNPGGRVNIFVNALACWRGDILVGTEDGLFRYVPTTGEVFEIPVSRNSVKTFGTDADGNVLVGTDNGLYVLGPEGIRHIRHEAGREDSLGNDIVWSILRDRDGTIWLGTDESVSATLPPVPFTGIAAMTGSREGNRFTSILKDRRGRLWLGGTDGLLCQEKDRTIWYRVDDAVHTLAHNRIRQVYEDKDGDIWLCTDGSLHILEGRRFRRLDLSDSTGERNANWAYDIVEDRRGRIWVATSLGGVLIKDKAALLAGDHVADSTVTLPDGSYGLYASQLAEDARGGLWCLFYNDGLRRFQGGRCEVFSPGEIPSCLYGDTQGRIWVAYSDRLEQGEHTWPLPLPGEVLCMGEVDGGLWISTAGGVAALDPGSGRMHRIYTGGRTISAILGDGPQAILGTRDGIIQAPAAMLQVPDRRQQVLLSAVTLDNTAYYTWKGQAVRYADVFVFGPDQTHLTFHFSDMPYDGREPGALVWRLAGIDAGWNLFPKGTNQLSFNQLNHGKYTLEVCTLDPAGQPAGLRTVHFRIRRPWYLRGWAFLLYLLVGAGLAVWIIRYYRLRARWQYEQREKDAMLDNLMQLSLPAGPVDLVDLARRCFEDFKAGLSDGREAQFVTQVPGCVLTLEEYRIATALENILANAAEYGLGRIEMQVGLREDRIAITVSDEGPGIPAAELPHVKERFFRGRAATRSGAGVGLYLADVYTARNGGALDIRSDASQGTRVQLSFPVAPAVQAEGQPSPDERFLTDITALIEAHMEDNAFNVASLSERTGLGGKLVYRKVKQLTGLTPVEYLRTLRLRKAAALLRENRYTVSEVMYRVGFTNASYFSKCFQAEFGTTPKHYAEGDR